MRLRVPSTISQMMIKGVKPRKTRPKLDSISILVDSKVDHFPRIVAKAPPQWGRHYLISSGINKIRSDPTLLECQFRGQSMVSIEQQDEQSRSYLDTGVSQGLSQSPHAPETADLLIRLFFFFFFFFFPPPPPPPS